MGVSWELQGVYSDNNSGGSVVTILLKNENDVPLPVDAFEDPTLERADGNGGWAKINSLPYDEQSAPDVEPPGLRWVRVPRLICNTAMMSRLATCGMPAST